MHADGPAKAAAAGMRVMSDVAVPRGPTPPGAPVSDAVHPRPRPRLPECLCRKTVDKANSATMAHRLAWRNGLKSLVLPLGAAIALGCGAPAFAAPPVALHPGAATGPVVLSPAPPPGTPSVVTPAPGATTIIVAPAAPPAARAETPPPPAPTFVWDPGRWAWNGVQYVWQPGKYVEKPMVTATFVPGHWRQGPDGWVWTDSHWDYSPGR